MRKFTRHSGAILLIATIIFTAVNCTKNNQVIDSNSSTTAATILNSIKGTATLQPIGGSAWDGTIEAAWANAPKLSVLATVPAPGNNTFTGYNGNTDSITIRSMYDAANIYFLVEFNSDFKSVYSSPWYFNPTTKLWAQEVATPSKNADGVTFRPSFSQDQFVIMFNINNSCPSFNTLSCYAACHINTGYGDSSVGASGTMHTVGSSEILDVWRARTIQVLNENQLNDCYIWDGGGVLNKNEVTADPMAATSDGGFSNKQTKTITGTTTKVSIPTWVIPAGGYSNGVIFQKDTLSGTAIKVTAVDTNGVLTLANGSKIDPRTSASGTNYQQVGYGDGPNCIPGSIVSNYTGSRGDVTANYYWTGTGWRLLLSRKLNTGDTKYDADFSSLADQPFGVGVMFDGADNQHAIVPGLTLHFKK